MWALWEEWIPAILGNYARSWQRAVGPLGKNAKKQCANLEIKKLIAFALRRGNFCHLGKGILLRIPPTQRYRIFFFHGKDCVHSLAQIWKNLHFFSEGCIFFSETIFNFFPEKCISWSKSQNPLKILESEKNTARKKKYTIFTHSVDLERKWHESNLFQDWKKIRYLCPSTSFFWGNYVFLIIALVMTQFTLTHSEYFSGDVHYIN